MKATLSLNLPALNLTKPVMTAIAQDILAIIKIRIYKGLDIILTSLEHIQTSLLTFLISQQPISD
jgi:hypothetical protein